MDSVQYFSDLMDRTGPMTREEYIELIVRSLFIRKIMMKKKRKRTNKLALLLGTLISCTLAYIIKRYTL